jgi:pyruvate dehydrogenase E2 component (dihydrolipoamide acetyltransferase)
MSDGIYAVTVPKWGIEMQEGTVVDWHAAEGAELAMGDELIDVETDKIVNTMEAPSNGVLRKRIAEKGETLKVGALLGVIAPSDIEDSTIDAFIADFRPAEVAVSAEDAESAVAAPTEPAEAKPTPAPPGGNVKLRKVRVSPAAAHLARELGVDINQVTGSGRRISPQDVQRFAEAHGNPQIEEREALPYEAQPLSATRQSIARKLTEAKQQIPHFYLSMAITMDKALARRQEINEQETQNISVNDVVMRATVLALQAVPDMNIHLVQNEIRRFSEVNLAMAVATDRGIITPVVHKADSMSVGELAKAASALSARARDASLAREDLDGGTFTVSNLGMYGISEFQAIINPPQGAILALGCCEGQIIPDADGFREASVMRVSLSCDHRAIDGATGAQFLAKLKESLEAPEKL